VFQRKIQWLIVPALAVGLILGLAELSRSQAASVKKKNHLRLWTTSFPVGGPIPAKYTCDGVGISPELSWKNLPPKTKSLALIMDDPDAAYLTWTHWIVYNIPPNVTEFLEDFPKDTRLTNGITQGTSDFKTIGYGPPCPPNGTHRYFFKLYALDTMLDLEGGALVNQLTDAMKGHILAQTEILGLYGGQ